MPVLELPVFNPGKVKWKVLSGGTSVTYEEILNNKDVRVKCWRKEPMLREVA